MLENLQELWEATEEFPLLENPLKLSLNWIVCHWHVDSQEINFIN